MEFFSGLKNAYDSFGTELSRTFDSSQTEVGGGGQQSRDPEVEPGNDGEASVSSN